MYTLKQACQIINLTEHTIRYYTDIGIVEVKRDKNNHHLFDEQALDWLKGTKYLRELGMSIQDIKLFHELCKKEGDQAIQERLDILIKQKEKAEEEIKKIIGNQILKFEKALLNKKIEDDKTMYYNETESLIWRIFNCVYFSARQEEKYVKNFEIKYKKQLSKQAKKDIAINKMNSSSFNWEK